jgi:hypothetical protein
MEAVVEVASHLLLIGAEQWVLRGSRGGGNWASRGSGGRGYGGGGGGGRGYGEGGGYPRGRGFY